MRPGVTIALTAVDRRRLGGRSSVTATFPQKHAWRAEIVLLTADGLGTVEIMRRTGKSKTCVWRWQERFAQEGVDGLLRDKTRPSRVKPLRQEVIDKVVALTATEPPHEATHWTAAAMAEAVGISLSSVQRIWKAHDLQPHRILRFKLSHDPEFVPKLRDVVGLYVDPPAHAVVLSVDEKSQIQALGATAPPPCLPPSTCSTAPSSAAACSAIGTRSSSVSSTPSRRRCRPVSSSTSSSTTTPPTSTQR